MKVLEAVTAKKTYTGAGLVLETLKGLGVDTVFGYPGSAILSLYDELSKQNDIKHYLVRHEQAAVHAAEGYARVSDKCGVVFVTSGPGATNTVSGIANAYMDGYPILVISGQVSKKFNSTQSFQEINILDITKTCTKSGYSITNIEVLQSTLRDAYNCAISGKKGPVVVDISKDVLDKVYELKTNLSYTKETPNIEDNILKNILTEIKQAKSPIIVAGGGVVHSNASDELNKLLEMLNIPVVTTMMGIGTVSPNYLNYAGMIGSCGSNDANELLKNSDLILSLGARFNDKITCCFSISDPFKKFIQVDINEDEISKTFPAHIAVIADVKYFLAKLNRTIKSNNYHLKITNKKFRNEIITNKEFNSNNIYSCDVIKEIYNLTKDFNPIITTEVGQHQISLIKNYRFSKPRQLITSGGLGIMGFGLPAAIGACIASGLKSVICIAGDGSFQMNEQELATIREYNLPIKIFIMNNSCLGMLRQLQQNFYEGRYSQTKIINPDFVKLSESYNIPAIKVDKKSDINTALKKAFTLDSPCLIDFIIEQHEIV